MVAHATFMNSLESTINSWLRERSGSLKKETKEDKINLKPLLMWKGICIGLVHRLSVILRYAGFIHCLAHSIRWLIIKYFFHLQEKHLYCVEALV